VCSQRVPYTQIGQRTGDDANKLRIFFACYSPSHEIKGISIIVTGLATFAGP
jgi:hypothetical protein